MPLDASRLASAIVSALKAAEPTTTEAKALLLWTPVATAIVNELKNNADVTAGTFLDSTSAPITGKGKVT